jgi:hypothetical protein
MAKNQDTCICPSVVLFNVGVDVGVNVGAGMDIVDIPPFSRFRFSSFRAFGVGNAHV